MIRFYSPEIAATGLLPETESGHCIRVLRMKAGDVINVVDGYGGAYECEITDPHPKHAAVRILNEKHEEKSWPERIILGVAPTKNIDRIEWLMEKAVEIGVDSIVLLECTHSERRRINSERLEKIMVSAMKQSLKARLPEFGGMVPLKEFLENCDTQCRYVGYCDEESPRANFADSYPGDTDVSLLIGPEGDFAPEEIRMAREYGFSSVTFGDERLRTETAALYGLTAIHVIDQIRRQR